MSLLFVVWTCVVGRASAEELAKVDFARDVQPLFNAHCIECHGAQQQRNGFRLDRRRDVLLGGTGTMIARGNAASSRLYLKLMGDQYGPQMPPAAELAQEEIDIIKAWIDQGASWPDELAGEAPPPVADPKATRMMQFLRDGNREQFRKLLREDAAVAKRAGPGGSTPLMYAVLYADADAVRLLLQAGADPNMRNESGATALMWAVDDMEKTRLLLGAGAEVNARSTDGRTPLLIATGYYGASPVVKLLLDQGADPSAKAASYRGMITPLRQASRLGDVEVLQILLARGGDIKSAGPFPLVEALNSDSAACAELLMKSAPPAALQQALLFVSPPFGSPGAFSDSRLVRQLIARGADVNAMDRAGRTLLMLTAYLDCMPVDTAKALLAHGADVNAKTADGRTALDFARQQGETPLVELLTQVKEFGRSTKDLGAI
jgi:ankyrin repeat protein